MEGGGLRVKNGGYKLRVKNEGGCVLEDGLVWYINCLHTSFRSFTYLQKVYAHDDGGPRSMSAQA